MARIRSIKPEYWSSEQIMDLSLPARLAFIGLWNFSDDGGNHPASARTLKAEVFPADDISADAVQALVDELLAQGLISSYVVQGKAYWHVTGWSRHQRIDKPTYKHPSPTERAPSAPSPIVEKLPIDSLPISKRSSDDPRLIDEDSSSGRRVIDEASTPDRNGVERSGEIPPIPPTPDGAVGKAAKRSATGLPTWLAEVRAKGEKSIPDGDPVFDYAEQAGLPGEFLRLAWIEFRIRYSQPDAKRYKDWRAVFRKAVRGNWLRLWRADTAGGYVLTTEGLQAQRVNGGAA